MCLTRSPPKPTESASTRNDPIEDESFANEDQPVSVDDLPEDSGFLNKSSNDLCLELESDTDEDDGILSSGLGNPKPPKKARRGLYSSSLEIEPPAAQSSSSCASATSRGACRGRPRGRARGRGRPHTVHVAAPEPEPASTRRRGRPRGSARGSTRGRPRGV